MVRSLFFFLAPWTALSLIAALVLVKTISAAILLVTIYVYWRVLIEHRLPPLQQLQYVGMFALNPFVIQTAVVDVHSDLLLLCAILCSYYFFLKRRWVFSMFALFLGGGIKFIPWFLLCIPAWQIVRTQPTWQRRLAVILCTGTLVLGAIVLMYLPFFSAFNSIVHAMGNEAGARGSLEHSAPMALLISVVSQADFLSMKVIAVIAAAIAQCWYVKRNQSLYAYTVPLIILCLGTSWFEPWYALWFFPLLYLMVPSVFMILLSVVLFRMPEFLSASALWPFVVLPFFLTGHTSKNKKSL